MNRGLFTMLVAVFLCVPLPAADRSPDPVDPVILEAPTEEHIPTLIAALNGSDCRPVHSDAGDALVKIGKPAVAPLVERMYGTTNWWIQLECVHLLGLMGEAASAALPELERYLAEDHHGLPQSYAEVSLAAVRGDSQGLCEVVRSGRTNLVPFALELLEQMGPDAAPVVPALREIAQSATDRRGTQVATFLESYESRIAAAGD